MSMIYGMTEADAITSTSRTCARISPPADRDALCLDLMTDEQALATWERMKAVSKAYVEAIFAKVPA